MEPTGEQPQSHEQRRFALRFSAGLVVVFLLIALAAAVAVGILLSRDTTADPEEQVTTIADLRADPEGWDAREVTLHGSFDDVRELPLLDQYALYTFTDETGSIRVLSRNGAPQSTLGNIELVGVFHSSVQLDEAIKLIVEQQVGGLAGSVISSVIPDIPLDVVFLEHESYRALDE